MSASSGGAITLTFDTGDLPVRATIASQFADPGVTTVFVGCAACWRSVSAVASAAGDRPSKYGHGSTP